MPPASPARAYRPGEEIANSVTHGIGAGLAIAALGVLTAFASRFGDAWHVVSVSIYGATLILLYTASTLYHGIPLPRAKAVLRVLDHVAIFLLIAGTYTPFTLVNLRGPWGWTLFGLIWALAAFGIVFELTPLRRFQRVSLSLYLGMGWVVVVAVRPLWNAMAPGGLILLAAGGLCYTLGVIFYVWRRLPYHHAIWHLFVLGGSVCHFFTVLFYVIPLGG
ncbi:MAG: PAQR family membrane homeostasis protein TrhA [Thermodesulfobacteriota bacterium]